MDGPENQYTINKLGEENEKKGHHSPTKAQPKIRTQTLAYRDTNTEEERTGDRHELHQEKDKGEGILQENRGSPSASRWLPTRVEFTVCCDKSDSGESDDSSLQNLQGNQARLELQQEQQEENQEPEEFGVRKRLIERRRPLAQLSPNHEELCSKISREADTDDKDDSSGNHSSSFADERREYRGDSPASDQAEHTSESQASSGRRSASAEPLARRGLQAGAREVLQSINVSLDSSLETDVTGSDSRLYTVEEHEDRSSIDPIYIMDVYHYMRHRELELYPLGRNFLEFQRDIDGQMRYILIDWLSEAAAEFNLSTDALHMAVAIVDRVLLVLQCPRSSLQLIGVVALMLATKFEEIYPPPLKEFERIANYEYSGEEITLMERIAFARIDHQVVTPTSWWFASRLTRMSHAPKKIYCMVRYLLEIALLDPTFLDYRPSVIGAASFFLSSLIFHSDYELLNTATDITIAELRLPARKMLQIYQRIPNYEYKAVFDKYSVEKYGYVSCLSLSNSFPELNDVQ